MTEEHFNNGLALLSNRNRISTVKAELQENGKMSVLDRIQSTDTEIFVQIKEFAIAKLQEEETRFQALFSELQE